MDKLNSKTFRAMLENGVNNLSNKRFDVDAMNVFPVPDGDTGTNMYLTFSSGVQETHSIITDNVGEIAKVLSRGLLMGARGNSGVILSQIFRGFGFGVEKCQEVDIPTLAQAFVKGAQVAYKAVMKPVEGTILTVIREGAEMAQDYVEKNPECTLLEYIDKLVASCHDSLAYTPELMPLLKEVGVVDSGGFGLTTILEGFAATLHGEKIELKEGHDQQTAAVQDQLENSEFGYCTEFILKLSESGRLTFEEDKLKRNLSRIGESLVVVQDDDLVKVHVHTMMPGDALNMAQRYGEFIKLKIENMQQQHEHIIEMAKSSSKYGIITVAAGNGLIKLFRDLRVDEIVNGGQTMNPSTEDFVAAVKKLNAEHVIILPNNSNIIMAAQQVGKIMKDVDVRVLPTVTIPQGLSACMMFNPEIDIDENLAEMTAAMQRVVTGQITYAVKDTKFDGMTIAKGDYIGIKDKDIVVSAKDMLTTCESLVDQIIFKDAEIATIIAGADTKAADITHIKDYIERKYAIEADVYQGDQPVYSFIFGIE